MKFKSNARRNEPKEKGTIFLLEDNKLKMSIHRRITIRMADDDTWFLSCKELQIYQRDLHESDFRKAMEKAKIIISKEIQELQERFDKIKNDKVIEFV